MRKNLYINSESALKHLITQKNQSLYITNLILKDITTNNQLSTVINLLNSLSDDNKEKSDLESRISYKIYSRIISILNNFKECDYIDTRSSYHQS